MTPAKARARRAPTPARVTGDSFILLGEGGERPFDAVSLERELRTMWKSPSGSGAFYRAALANLVVPLEPDATDSLSTVMADVIRRHPARLFRIQSDRGNAPDPHQLSTRATALCHLRPGGGGFVCSEQVLLEWSEPTGHLVPSAVGSLLIGDLPVVLLSIGPGPAPPWEEELIAMADLEVADSGAEEEVEAYVRFWKRVGCSEGPLHDLAWARLMPWRALIAEAFDDPVAALALRSIRQLTVHYGGMHPPAGAWLLAAWVASRLGWRFEERDGLRARFQSPSGPVSISFSSEEGERPGALRRVHFRAAGASPLDLVIDHPERERTARVERLAPCPSVIEALFHYLPLALTIVGEIQRQDPSPTFEAAARWAIQMIES